MPEIRAVKMNGDQVMLVGREISAGQRAPEFHLTDNDIRDVALSDSKGKVRFIATFPSLRTGQCRYVAESIAEEAIDRLKTLYYVVSVEPPSLQAQYCRDDAAVGITTLSDYRDQNFGRAYGVLTRGSSLLAPAVFVVDADDIVRYAEYFDSMEWLPQYDQALAAMKEALEECSRD